MSHEAQKQKDTHTESQEGVEMPQQQIGSELAKVQRTSSHGPLRYYKLHSTDDAYVRLSKTSQSQLQALDHMLVRRLTRIHLLRGERTASALETRLDGIENRIDQLLASMEGQSSSRSAGGENEPSIGKSV